MKHIILLILLSVSTLAQAYHLEDKKTLQNERLQNLYNFTIAHRHPQSSIGMCKSFQKIKSYTLENDESDTNGSALFIVRDALISFNPEEMDIMTASRVEFDDDTFEEQLNSLANKIIADEFKEEWKNIVRGIIKNNAENVEIFGGSIAFQKACDHKYLHNVLDHFSFIDIQTKELFYFGAGVCEY